MKIEGLWICIYHHRHGVEAHPLFKIGAQPTDEEAIKTLELDFEENSEEYLEIEAAEEVPEVGKQPEGQWTTTCPECKKKDCLFVYKARLVANGKIIRPETPLTPDGFETDPNNDYAELKDHSTEDEKVECHECKARFDLSDLTTD